MRRDEAAAEGWGVPGGGLAASRLVALRTAITTLSESSLVGPLDPEIGDDLISLTRLHAQLTSVMLKYAAEADRRSLGEATGATHTAAWWAHQTKLTRAEANRLVALGRALDEPDRQSTSTAYASGSLLTDQVHAITQALTALPDEIGPDLCAKAEAFLIEAAADHDAKALRIMGRRILDIVAPEIGEAHEERLVHAEEQAADAAVRLSMSDDGHGRTHGRFTLPTAQADMFRKQLMALANPRRAACADDGEQARPDEDNERDKLRPLAERLGLAFIEYIERYPVDRTPDAGGVSARMVVTMPLGTLLGGLGSAHLDTGTVISASQARRLACEAGIIPAVLGGKSEILDLGRSRRLHSTAQRIALNVRDGGCTAEGCDRPPGGCHAHHDIQWSKGGPTSVEAGRLLCPRHHRLAHNPSYDMKIGSNNQVGFYRRT